MTALIFQVLDTVDKFSGAQIIDIVQIIVTLLIALITAWVSIQQTKIKGKVIAVDTKVDLVHKEINSKMQKALDAQYDLGKADEKAANAANTESKPNKSE